MSRGEAHKYICILNKPFNIFIQHKRNNVAVQERDKM